jgi:hypothetical protein
VSAVLWSSVNDHTEKGKKMFCIVLYCAVMHYAVLYCIALNVLHAMPCHAMSYHAMSLAVIASYACISATCKEVTRSLQGDESLRLSYPWPGRPQCGRPISQSQ